MTHNEYWKPTKAERKRMRKARKRQREREWIEAHADSMVEFLLVAAWILFCIIFGGWLILHV